MSYGCPLADAFNLDKPSKKKYKKFKTSNRSLTDIQNEPTAFIENQNEISMNYDSNKENQKLREQVKLLEQKNMDEAPNKWQKDLNTNFKNPEFEEIQIQIRKLFTELQEIKSVKKPDTIEGFSNYQPPLLNKSITFDNDQFNELLLYIFTGIFILILIDYIYKLGQKSF